MENAITFGDYGPFNNKATALLQVMKVGDAKLEDVALRGMQPVMSVILRMLLDIYIGSALCRGLPSINYKTS